MRRGSKGDTPVPFTGVGNASEATEGRRRGWPGAVPNDEAAESAGQERLR